MCGPNPQPAPGRALCQRHRVGAQDRTCDVVLRVEDRQGSGEQPFAIDVFFAAVELLGDLRLQAAAGMRCEGFSTTTTTAADGQSLRLAADKGVLETKHTGPDGRYAVLAVRLTEGFDGRSKLRMLAAGKTLASWTLSVNDGAAWWAVSPAAELRSGETLQVEIEREGRESPHRTAGGDRPAIVGQAAHGGHAGFKSRHGGEAGPFQRHGVRDRRSGSNGRSCRRGSSLSQRLPDRQDNPAGARFRGAAGAQPVPAGRPLARRFCANRGRGLSRHGCCRRQGGVYDRGR